MKKSGASSHIGEYFELIANNILDYGVITEEVLSSAYSSIVPENMQEVIYHYINKMCE